MLLYAVAQIPPAPAISLLLVRTAWRRRLVRSGTVSDDLAAQSRAEFAAIWQERLEYADRHRLDFMITRTLARDPEAI